MSRMFTHELATAVCAPAAVLSDRDGQVRRQGAQGFLVADVRHLSELTVLVNGEAADSIGHWPESADVLVKVEGGNPTGSYKDRMALAIIEGAEDKGALRPGQPVVEYTGGSTGSSLAFVCAVKGHPLWLVSSDAFSPEKLTQTQAHQLAAADADLAAVPAADLVDAFAF